MLVLVRRPLVRVAHIIAELGYVVVGAPPCTDPGRRAAPVRAGTDAAWCVGPVRLCPACDWLQAVGARLGGMDYGLAIDVQLRRPELVCPDADGLLAAHGRVEESAGRALDILLGFAEEVSGRFRTAAA